MSYKFFFFTLFATIYENIKYMLQPTISEGNCANKDLYYQDLIDGMSIEQRTKYLKNGRYKVNESYPKPHRDKDGKIIIENYELYKEDIINYGAIQAHKWMNQGKYN